MFDVLARLVPRWRWSILLGAGLVIAASLVLTGDLEAKLTSGLSDYEDQGSASARAGALVQDATGIDIQQGVVAVVRADAPLAAGEPLPPVVTDTARLLREQPGVVRVEDLSTTGDPRMISSDGESTYLVAALGPVDDRVVTERLEREVAASDLLRDRVLLGGPTVASAQDAEQASSDLYGAELLALPLLLVLLVLAFRGLVAALLPLLGAAVAIVVTLLALRGAVTLTDVSVFALNLVLGLGVALSIDFNLLLVSRFREEVAGYPPAQAAARTVRTAGRTVAFSAATICCALATLLLFPQRFLVSMGLAGILVTAAAGLVALTVVPALLAVSGRRVDALSVGRRRRRDPAQQSGDQRGGWWRVSTAVMRRPAVAAGAATLVIAALAAPAVGAELRGADASALAPELSARQVIDALATEFPDAPVGGAVAVVAQAPPEAAGPLAGYAERLTALPHVVGAGPPRPMGTDTWVVDVFLDVDAGTPAAVDTVGAVRDVPAPYPTRVGGAAAGFADLQASLLDHLPLVLALLGVATFLLLMAMTRSVVLPVKTFLMSLLSVAATMGVLAAVFQNEGSARLVGLDAPVGLEPAVLVLVFVLAFGLSTDYGAFVLARAVERHAAGDGTRMAVATAVQHTGRVVTYAAVLFSVAMGALVLADSPYLKQLGLGAATAVIVDATLLRVLLMPALMALLGRWNWWLPGGMARIRTGPRLRPAFVEEES